MSLSRKVSSETLDNLPENDPDAIRSRLDLRRVHSFMRTRSILLDALGRIPSLSTPFRILELGAGDGTLMLSVAKRITNSKAWPELHLTLLDRQNLVSEQTLQGYRELGWHAEVMSLDVLDWINSNQETKWDLVLANLFIHHFEGGQLSALINTIAARSNTFIACEPRRAWLPLMGSHLIGLIGANAVTREDAVLSVHAGFRDQELSALWPLWPQAQSGWQLTEYAAGLFSHCLIAVRTDS